MKAKPTARKMYVLYFRCLSHSLEIDETSEGHRFKQEHHSSQVLDHNIWMHCVCFTDRFWPLKHMRIPGFRPHGSLSSFFVWFVQYAPLQTWEAGDAATPESRWCPGGQWGVSKEHESMETMSKERPCSKGRWRDAEWGWEETLPGLWMTERKFCQELGCWAVLATIRRVTPSLGRGTGWKGSRGKGDAFLKPLFMRFLSYLITLNLLHPKELLFLLLILMIIGLF